VVGTKRCVEMSILTDREIRQRVNETNMIMPFVGKQIREVENWPVISYGLSSHGYDVRAGTEWQVFERNQEVLDPKGEFKSSGVKKQYAMGDRIILPPNSFALTYSFEAFKIPSDIMAICFAKSTYARLGIVLGVTPLEAGWRGHVTIELTNSTPNEVAVYAGERNYASCFFEVK
jgi:dCTP deaminase